MCSCSAGFQVAVLPMGRYDSYVAMQGPPASGLLTLALGPGCVKLENRLSSKQEGPLLAQRAPGCQWHVTHAYFEPVQACQAAAHLWIQDIHCCPLPRGPPAKIWKTGVILAIAPPSLASTMPVRTCRGRTPQPGSSR